VRFRRHGTIAVSFGDLLVAYQDIPDSLFGILEMAREQRLVDFHAGMCMCCVFHSLVSAY